jgi:hypothetical protein
MIQKRGNDNDDDNNSNNNNVYRPSDCVVKIFHTGDEHSAKQQTDS